MTIYGIIKPLNNSLTNIDVNVGSDGKLHFVDATGADTVLNFSTKKSYRLSIKCVGNGGSVVTSTAYLYDASTSALIASTMLQTASSNTSGMNNSTSGTW